jgi:hypothetical protein
MAVTFLLFRAQIQDYVFAAFVLTRADQLCLDFVTMCISGPSPKQPGPALTPMVEMLREATSKVSGQLGYGGPWPPEPIEQGRSR